MKRLLTILLAALLLLGVLAGSALAEETGDAAAVTAEAAGRATARAVTLKRGKTLQLWVYPFSSTTQFYKDCGKEYPVGSISFSGTSGTVQAKVTSGETWLKAKKTSSGWKFYVKSRNLTNTDKKGVIKITDGKGAFATIRVTRGGIVNYSKIYSRGTSVYAKIKTNASHPDLYVYRWIFNASGKLVSKTKFQLSGSSFRDTVKKTYRYYTVAYTVGYCAEATNKIVQTGAAAVYLSDSLSNTGKVKIASSPEKCLSSSWLYGLAH